MEDLFPKSFSLFFAQLSGLARFDLIDPRGKTFIDDARRQDFVLPPKAKHQKTLGLMNERSVGMPERGVPSLTGGLKGPAGLEATVLKSLFEGLSGKVEGRSDP
jgi:hypothetical protein